MFQAQSFHVNSAALYARPQGVLRKLYFTTTTTAPLSANATVDAACGSGIVVLLVLFLLQLVLLLVLFATALIASVTASVATTKPPGRAGLHAHLARGHSVQSKRRVALQEGSRGSQISRTTAYSHTVLWRKKYWRYIKHQ